MRASDPSDTPFSNFGLVTDTDLRPSAPVVPKPAYLGSFTDPVFGTRITRITGDPDAAIPTIGGTWPAIARHHYSKDAAWNADQSLIVLHVLGKDEYMLFLNGETYGVLFERTAPSWEARWHPTSPNTMIYVKTSGEIGSWDVVNDRTTVLHRISGYEACYFGPWEGNLSQDGTRLVVAATKRSNGQRVAFLVDLAAGPPKKYPDIRVVEEQITPDFASASASGKHIVMNGTINGHHDATQVFDANGAKVGSPWKSYGLPSHYDLTFDTAGHEVAVGVAKSGARDGRVIKRDLLTGAITPLNQGGYAYHISARNTHRPGWAYVTTNYLGRHYPPFRDEIFAVKLDGSLQVQRFANVRSTASRYESESQAVPSPDGKRMIFASDWMNAAGPIQAYVVDIRPLET